MSLAKIPSRTDYVDEVYKTLLDAISAGKLAPGERITQEDLAERLNVSRSPVLRALRLLKKDGLLEEAPGRGLVVAQLNPVQIGHLYQVRGALDGLAARLASSRHAKIPLSLIDAGREAAVGSDVKAMIEADTAFHKAIYEASGNPFIVDNAMLHWIHLRRVMGPSCKEVWAVMAFGMNMRPSSKPFMMAMAIWRPLCLSSTQILQERHWLAILSSPNLNLNAWKPDTA